MKLVIPKGSMSRIITVFIQDNTVTTGAGLAGLDESAGITGGYVREGSTGVALAVDENVTTEGTYQAPSGAGHVRIGTPANMRPGTYELHFHNNLWASGAETVTITLGGADDMADIAIEVQLSDPVRGLGAPTALPNAAAEAPGGLYTRGSGAGQIAQDANGRVNVNVAAIETADPSDTIRDAIVDDATRIDASALNTLSSHDPGETIMGATDLGTGSGLTSLASASALATVDGIVDSILVTAGKLDDTLENDGGTYRFTANALEEGPAGGGGGGATAEEVWEYATRTLTAGTNIALAKGTGITGFNDLDAAGVRSAVGLASANMDSQLGALATSSALTTVGNNVSAMKNKTDQLNFGATGAVDANITYVNETAVGGAGTEGDPWSPAA